MLANRTIVRLEEMLDDAIEGTFVEDKYDESRMSRLESRWKDFLSNSVLSNKNLETERQRLEQFISDISHQTKTPMTNIKMYSTLLSEEVSRGEDASLEKIRNYSSEIEKQTSRLEFLIESLTKLSRLENGTLSLSAKKEDTNKLIRTSISAIESKAALKNIKIILDDDNGLTSLFDMKWTNEALVNILDNSVKYTPEGGEIKVFTESFEMYNAIHVVDSGPGISEEEAARIFGRFYRGNEVKQEEGIGIGLYLAREIISKEDYHSTFERCRTCLYYLAKKQSVNIDQDKPTHKFIRKLYSLIESGQAVLLDKDNPFDFKPVNYIGYQDDEYYYLNADIAHKQVKRLCNEQDEAFSISKNGLIKALAEEGLTVYDKRKNTKSIRIGDKTLRFICLIKDKADAVAALSQ